LRGAGGRERSSLLQAEEWGDTEPKVGARPKGPVGRSPRVRQGPAATSFSGSGQRLQGQVTRYQRST